MSTTTQSTALEKYFCLPRWERKCGDAGHLPVIRELNKRTVSLETSKVVFK